MTNEVNEDPAERARKYIASFEKALQRSTITKNDTLATLANITRASDTIQRYLWDARYYLENEKPTTALASIAYAEGLLDALAFLGLAKNKTAEQPF